MNKTAQISLLLLVAIVAHHLSMPTLGFLVSCFMVLVMIIDKGGSLIVLSCASAWLVTFPLGQVVVRFGHILGPFISACQGSILQPPDHAAVAFGVGSQN